MASTFLAIFGLVTPLIRSSTSVTSVYSDGAEEKALANGGQGVLIGRAAKQPNYKKQDWTIEYLTPTYTAVSS